MIKHICPFCNNELSFDTTGAIQYYQCFEANCMLGSCSRYEYHYIKDELVFRSIIVFIDSIAYRLECSYYDKHLYIERIDKILSKSLPGKNVYLPISVFKIENFIVKPNDNEDDILKIVKRFLNLRAFL